MTRSEASGARVATMARPSSEVERLTQLIQQWNVDHYDLFELSVPDQVRTGSIFSCTVVFLCALLAGCLDRAVCQRMGACLVYLSTAGDTVLLRGLRQHPKPKWPTLKTYLVRSLELFGQVPTAVGSTKWIVC